MNHKIKIKNSSNADSRTSKNITEQTLAEATNEHLRNVQEGMSYIASLIKERGYKHDYTKINEHFSLFEETVLKELSSMEFKQSEWYQNHIHTERHHLNENAPADVNLIDVIEMLVDCVMAGKGRSGYISSYYCKIRDPALLERAYWNTIILLDEIIEIEDGDDNDD